MKTLGVYIKIEILLNTKLGVRDTVWFGFENKSHPNHKKKNMMFGLVGFKNKIRTKPNQTNAVWVGSVGAIFFSETIQFFVCNIIIKLKS